MNTIVRPEMAARINVNTLLDALLRGDYAEAATAQARLEEDGWYFSRQAPGHGRRTTRQKCGSR